MEQRRLGRLGHMSSVLIYGGAALSEVTSGSRSVAGSIQGRWSSETTTLPSGDPAEMADQTEKEQQQLGTLQWFYENKFSFNQVMSQQPQTIAYGLTDSPVALLAWNAQLFGEDLDADFVLTNVTLYWLTGTGGSAARLYYEDAQATPPTEPTTMPTAVAAFGGDFSGVRRFAERDHKNIVSWTTYDHGGHFAAHKVPDLLVADIRAFFGPLA